MVSIVPEMFLGFYCSGNGSNLGLTIEEMFVRFDTSQDKLLSPIEIYELFHFLGMNVSARDVLHYFLAADKDGNMLISPEEFRAFFAIKNVRIFDGFSPKSPEVQERLDDRWLLFDDWFFSIYFV